MTTPRLPLRSAALAGAALAAAALSAAPLTAGGVDAGTLISNTATATFTTGGHPQSVTSNTVTVRVDELLNVTTVSNDAGPVTINGSAVLAFTVTNTGNGPEAFTLLADPNVGGNAFAASVSGLALDTNGNGTYEPGVDLPLINGGATPVLAADASQVVFVLVSAPTGLANGATSQVRLRAEAVTGTGAPGTLFAGAGHGGGAAVVGTSGASALGNGGLVAQVAAVSLVKSATIADPFGGSRPVPGATVTFSIVASVGGGAAADALVIADAIPAGTTYRPGSLRLDNAPLTDASDGDAGAFIGNSVRVDAGSVPVSATRTVTFAVTID
ncbi:hypothetical protein EYB45_02445 [Erythrobacteraceae bacterium CFH 75059]|uniref:hypothetical protein n=1 Tax=Qipengyuania thermophila TaxID=2509361 RepID=UPI001021C722|nr:hypothetical protein [Qipengyuania thermophila]TCD06590.1 hypothetical protein EYB45_02445 [Erythrobacteraceae bacterium CFH 75059]